MSAVAGERESLVEYETKIEISDPIELNKIRSLANKKKANLPPIESKPDVQSILKAILPPREWDHDGKHYVQFVSHKGASREDVTNLQNKLDNRLLSRQARESGICPIREELHSQCFDEIIRQVTIDCPERGLLLMRVRDELKMTIAAYQTLYKSAVAFGMRKQIQAEKGKKDLEDRIQSLESRKKELLEKVNWADHRSPKWRIRRRPSRAASPKGRRRSPGRELMRSSSSSSKIPTSRSSSSPSTKKAKYL